MNGWLPIWNWGLPSLSSWNTLAFIPPSLHLTAIIHEFTASPESSLRVSSMLDKFVTLPAPYSLGLDHGSHLNIIEWMSSSIQVLFPTEYFSNVHIQICIAICFVIDRSQCPHVKVCSHIACFSKIKSWYAEGQS